LVQRIILPIKAHIMLLWLALALLAIYLILGADAFRGSRRIDFLRATLPIRPQQALPVTLIAAARNEEKNLRAALASLLALDYPHLQLLLVNDRSADATGTILDEIAAQDGRLDILHIQELPPGWLGKNHALWQGSRRARGELLLFTDADVIMAPDTLARAVHYLQKEHLDHLAATPDLHMPGVLLNTLGVTFGLFLGLFTRPWRAPDRRSTCHIGIGAFNLVRTRVYRQVGGHQRIALRPDDDLKLGKLIKKSGFRQSLVYGNGLISVEWYAGVREMALGLRKISMPVSIID
jgi:cellulose synthase/poly-beta-1,6-N-acetylglucosamine synthase-like glycosyltransferase